MKRSRRTHTRRAARRKPTPHPSRKTALARIEHQLRKPAKVEIIAPPATVEDDRALRDQIAIGDLGLVEIALTPAEEAELAKPVNTEEIRIKPTGQAYLSHPSYTKWFNRAFGRTAWQLVPVSKPMMQGRSVVQPYVLHLHGKPIAFAMGEQEYFENNREQTYGDALESTVASALRRCAKRLGVGLEMWDKGFLDDWQAATCVRVEVEQKGKETKYLWRRKIDKPFWGEVDGSARKANRQTPPREETPAASHAAANEPITEQQLKKLWMTIRRMGRGEEEVKYWLLHKYKLDSTKAIKRKDFENIVHAIEHPGALQVRTPGEEG